MARKVKTTRPRRVHARLDEVAHRRLRLALRVAKRAEVVLAQELAQSLCDELCVERLVVPAHARAQDRRRHRLVGKQVAVGARARAVARVEFRAHLACPMHASSPMQVGVGSAHPRDGFAHRLGVEMHDLGGCVHAGIGAPRGGHLDGRVGETRERLLQVILHAAAARLRLPAAERRAVVFEAQGDAHGGFRNEIGGAAPRQSGLLPRATARR